jgi:hypothetical protein
MASNRVVVPDLAPPDRIRVPSFGGDTYTPPPKPVLDNNMDRLADALQHFSGALAGYSARQQVDEKDAARAEAERYLATSTNKQLWEAYKAGSLPRQANPVANGLYENALGTNAGTEFLAKVKTLYGPGGGGTLLNPDGSFRDPSRDIADMARDYVAVLPQGSKHALGRFNEAVQSAHNWTLQAQQQYAAERAEQDTGVTLQTTLRTLVGDDGLASRSPEDVGAAIGTYTKAAANALHIPYRDVDDALMGQLKLAMDPQTASPGLARNVLAILDAPRKAVDSGQAIGALANNPRFTGDVVGLRAAATKVLEKDWQAGQKRELAQKALDAWQRGDGSFDLIQDTVRPSPFTGQDFKVSGDDTRKDAIALFNTAVRDTVGKQLNGQPRDVQERIVFNTVADQFIRAGVPNPEWKDALEAVPKAVGDTTSLTNPSLAARTKAAVNLYGTLRERSPAYVDGMLSTDSRNFYEAYILFRQLGQGDDVALRNAAVVQQPENRNDPAVRARWQDIESAVGDQGVDRLLGSNVLYNAGDAYNRILRGAIMVSRAQGVSAKAAIDAVSEKLKADTPVVHGQALFTRSAFMTKEKVPVVEKVLEAAYDQHKKVLNAYGINDPSDLSVRFSGGVYQVVGAKDGAPLPVPGASGFMTFTDRQLQAMEKSIADAKTQAIVDERAKFNQPTVTQTRSGPITGPSPAQKAEAAAKAQRGLIERSTQRANEPSWLNDFGAWLTRTPPGRLGQ